MRGLTKRFGPVQALTDVTMTIPDGAFVVLLGPTGAGKTTTLRLIAGLDAPDAGEVAIAGRSVLDQAPAERDVAMVFQQYSLYPHLGLGQREEGDLEMAVVAARRLHVHLGEAKQLGEKWPPQLDGLDPIHGHLTVLAEEPTLLELHLSVRDPVAAEAPVQPRHEPDDGQQPDEHRQRYPCVRHDLRSDVVGAFRTPLRSVGRAPETASEHAEESLEGLRNEIAEDGQGHDSEAHDRRPGGQVSPPLVRILGWRVRLAPRQAPWLLGHSPARWLSPRAARRVRRPSASSTGSPLSAPPLDGLAVCNSIEASP